jgi:hypothetical protein
MGGVGFTDPHAERKLSAATVARDGHSHGPKNRLERPWATFVAGSSVKGDTITIKAP